MVATKKSLTLILVMDCLEKDILSLSLGPSILLPRKMSTAQLCCFPLGGVCHLKTFDPDSII